MTLYDRAVRYFERARGYKYNNLIEQQFWVMGWMAGYESAKRAARRRVKK